MMYFQYLILILYIFENLSSALCDLVITPQQPRIEYANSRFSRNSKFLVQKRSRNTPYYVTVHFDILEPVGNNVTMFLMEELSGRWQPLAFHLKYPLCDFLEHDPYIGRMFAQQMNNTRCPMQVGVYKYDDKVIDLQHFKFHLPSTFQSAKVKTKIVAEAIMNDKNDKSINIFRVSLILFIEEKRISKQKAKKQTSSTSIP